jgi:hypothetical protein
MKTVSLMTGTLLLLGKSRVLAQTASAPQWGISSTSAYVVTSSDMVTSTSATQWETLADGARYITGGGGVFNGAIHVPQGSILLSMELDACDHSDQGGVEAELFRTENGGGTLIAGTQTGMTETPGCSRFPASVFDTEVVDNEAHRYVILAHNETTDGSTSVAAIRVFYKLQVSPAPQNPTFGDVPPSDPAYQFIEALVASGVTAGCGGNNFCPDAPLTRRQMAVFLSKALGLSWAEVPAP